MGVYRSIITDRPGGVMGTSQCSITLILHRLPFLPSIFLLQARDDGRVRQSGRVSEDAPFGDVPQQTAHDLAAAGLGQVGREEDVVRSAHGAQLFAYEGFQLFGEGGRGVETLPTRNESARRLALDLV